MSINMPKKIHYCWFGGNPLPKLAQKCIDSWKKYCPDYEIIEWNESNFDIHCCKYVEEAYNAKKWAFVSDYARYKILYDYGGVYFDTDVELLKPINEIAEKHAYMGCENYTAESMCVNPGLGCASLPKNPFFEEVLNDYKLSHFINENGTLNLYTVVQRTTKHLKNHGLKNDLNIQTIAGITIYPAEYFSPKDLRDGKLKITPNTYSIHHYTASWFTKKTAIYSSFIQFIYRMLGERGFNFLKKHLGRAKKGTINDNDFNSHI